MLAGDCPAGSGAPPSRARAAYAYGGSGRLVAVVADLLYRRRDPAGNRGACGAHMAHPLVRAGALDLLEEAVRSMRSLIRFLQANGTTGGDDITPRRPRPGALKGVGDGKTNRKASRKAQETAHIRATWV